MDAVFRDALAQESAAALRHQVEVERRAAARMSRLDVLLSFFLAGIGAGVGFVGASGWYRKRRRAR